jgi:hypothetical protein
MKVADAPDGSDYTHAFTMNASLKSDKTYTIVCPDEEQKNKWLKCLVTTIRANDLGELHTLFQHVFQSNTRNLTLAISHSQADNFRITIS